MDKKDNLFDLIDKFVNIHAYPGREHALAKVLMDMSAPYCDECYTDTIGNVICKISGTGKNKKKVLFSAHMDEVAMMVTYIDANGSIRFTNNGGPGYISAAYTDVVFENGTHGVLTLDRAGSFDTRTMLIDIGASSKEEAEALVSVGDSFSVSSGISKLYGSRISGRPIDNRLGIAIIFQSMIDISERKAAPYNDIYFAFSVQEETACPPVGATVLANVIQPDIGIAIDGCSTNDTQGATPINAYLGCGAVISARETKLVTDKGLLDTMIKLSKEKNIKHTICVDIVGGTDATSMQIAGKGCKAGIISFPMRYLHTRTEMADLSDAEEIVKLVTALCDSPEFD